MSNVVGYSIVGGANTTNPGVSIGGTNVSMGTLTSRDYNPMPTFLKEGG
jgi:hypothetical protein